LSSFIFSSILAAKRIGGREEFHRHLFATMLGARARHEEPALQPAEAQTVLDLLARWIVEAPVNDDLGILRLLAARAMLRALATAAGAQYGPFLSKTLGLDERQRQDPGKLPGWKQAKLAALGDASLAPAESLRAWHGASPVYARLAAIAALDLCPTDAGLARDTAAVGHWLVSMDPIDLPMVFLEHLKVSAFHVSYLADGARHEIKRALVRQAAHMLGHLRFPPPQPAPGAAPARLTIVGELLFPEHAMFRCYAEVLAQLKDSFHVTLVADEPTRCAQHAGISHAQLYFPPGERDVGRLAALVQSTRPDIVLYPSIGMSYWTFALSLLRLAPLQLMSVGHPAPACSDQIDGSLIYTEMVQPAMAGYGRVHAYDRQPLPVSPPGGWTTSAKQADEALVVAINAAAMKLAPAFLDAVQAAVAQAPAGTNLEFFPNIAGPQHLALRRSLQERFPGALVHPTTDYATYMRALSRADLVLQSFPFGGTNTVMDALALGIPMVCMEGEDLAGAADPLILRHAGLGELCAVDQAHYVRLASGLLAAPQERARLGDLARAALGRLAALESPGTRSIAEALRLAWLERQA
jgi:hypothetical protein